MASEINQIIDINDIGKIKIDIDIAEVEIYSTKYSQIHINGTLGSGSSGITVAGRGSDLNIREKVSYIGMATLGFLERSHITIGIPEEFFGNLELNCGAGKTTVKDICVSFLQVGGGAGKVTIDNVKFNDLKIKVGVGETSVNLNNQCGNIKIDGGVGNVQVDLKEVGGDLKFKGGIGNTSIRIPEGAPVRFITSTGIGRCRIKAITSNENKYEFNLDAGIGEIKIYN